MTRVLELTTGNLLEAEVEALVNTVNTAGVMGKGIALQFKKAYPENFRRYKEACDAKALDIGQMLTHDAGGLVRPRYVINFPTKRHWRSPSTLEYIERGLTALTQEVRRLNIGSIAIPPLGCGNGGLQWTEVLPRIEAAFLPLEEVHVLLFSPDGSPPPETMKHRTPRPKMTRGRAAFLALMARYHFPDYDYPLTLIEAQKLLYFMQLAGEPLRLDYQRGHYGPYADNLRHVLNHLEGHHIVGFGDGRNKPDTPLKALPGATEEAEAFLAHHPDTQARIDRVARLIEAFETPFGMELLASVHWVEASRPADERSPDTALRDVHAWNERKASRMRQAHVTAAWERLRSHGWL